MTSAAARLPRSTPEEQGVDPAALLGFVDALVALPELHSVMVLRHGYVVAEGWAAPFGPDHLHRLYSLSKSFTSAAVGFARAEGLLDLDDRLLDHVGDDAPAAPDERLQRLTLRHLLTMRSGHHDDPSDATFSTEHWTPAFLAQPLQHEPGTHFVYNTAATYVLSDVVQRRTGQRLLDYLRPRLFDPLGFGEVTWEQSPDGVDTGGFGLAATTEDVAAFGRLLAQDGVWEGRQVLPAGWVAEATAAHVPPGDEPENDWAQGYGYQFWRSRHGYRGDGAFGQYCAVVPEQDLVVVTTSGRAAMHDQLAQVWTHLLPGLHDGPLAPDPEARAALARRLGSMTVPVPTAAATSPWAARVDGRRLTFEDAGTLRAATLTVGAEADTLVVELEGRTVEVRVGHDAPVAAVMPLTLYYEEELLVGGGWTADDEYLVAVRTLQGPYLLTARARFADDGTVTVSTDATVWMGPPPTHTFTGRVAD